MNDGSGVLISTTLCCSSHKLWILERFGCERAAEGGGLEPSSSPPLNRISEFFSLALLRRWSFLDLTDC